MGHGVPVSPPGVYPIRQTPLESTWHSDAWLISTATQVICCALVTMSSTKFIRPCFQCSHAAIGARGS